MCNYEELNDEELLALLFTEDDTLSREAVDELVRREDRMVAPLTKIISDHSEWWPMVHAVHILGAIDTEETVVPLLRGLRWADVSWCDWIWSALPPIFGRIGPVALPYLELVASDRTSHATTRNVCMEGMAAVSIHEPSVGNRVFSFIGACRNNHRLVCM